MTYDHKGTFTRIPESEGAGGQLVEGTASTIYDGAVDVQDNDRRQDIDAGIETSRGSTRVFFPVSILGLGLQVNDRASLVVGDETLTGRVDRTDHVDDSCLVLYD